MDVRGRDVGIHYFEMAFREIPCRRRGRDQMRPGIPAVKQRLYLNIGAEIQQIIIHCYRPCELECSERDPVGAASVASPDHGSQSEVKALRVGGGHGGPPLQALSLLQLFRRLSGSTIRPATAEAATT